VKLRFWLANLKEREQFEDLDVDGSINRMRGRGVDLG
jgi:hypothetical protein